MREYNVIPNLSTVDYDKIYHFSSLDQFKKSDLNRESNVAKIKEYAKLMKEGKWMFELSPIYVGIGSMEILNGETRRNAINLAKSKGVEINDISVIFVDDFPESRKKDVVEALNATKHWQIDDYISCWITQNVTSFKYLKDFCTDEDHPKLHSKNRANYGKGALLFGQTYQGFKKTYKNGNFTISEKDKKLAESRYEQIVRIIKALAFDASDDYWIPIAEAWYKVSSNKNNIERIKNLPDGFETFYNGLYEKYALKGSNNTDEWVRRFIEVIQDRYNEMYA